MVMLVAHLPEGPTVTGGNVVAASPFAAKLGVTVSPVVSPPPLRLDAAQRSFGCRELERGLCEHQCEGRTGGDGPVVEARCVDLRSLLCPEAAAERGPARHGGASPGLIPAGECSESTSSPASSDTAPAVGGTAFTQMR